MIYFKYIYAVWPHEVYRRHVGKFNAEYVYAYLGDGIICGNKNQDKHILNLRNFLQVVKKYNKCKIKNEKM